MPKFSVQRIKEIDGKLKFYKLIKNNKCEFDDFEESCLNDPNYESEYIKIQSIIQDVSDQKFSRLPKKKFKELTGRKKSDTVKDFEVKSKHLRLYFFKDKLGNIIVLGGKKTSQKKDIRRFRSIKKEYLEEKENA
ncbi:MAG: hypothetical protein ABJR05_09900 [Balneola sp.]